MYPSNPAQPPKPNEIPGITKAPRAPMRGQAQPAVDYRQAAARTLMQQRPAGGAPQGAQSMQAPQQSAKLSAPAQGPVPSPMQARAPQPAQSQAQPSMMARAAQSLSQSRAVQQGQYGGQAPSAADMQTQKAAALALQQKQQQAYNAAEMSQLGDNMLAGAMQGLTDKTKPVPGRQWDTNLGAWMPDDSLPSGVGADSPGVMFDPNQGRYVYDPKATAATGIDLATAEILGKTAEDYQMSDAQRQEQIDAIRREAANAQWMQGQQMAARGMGGSGVQALGLGDINANVMTALNDMNAADRAQAIEAFLAERGQDLGAFAQGRAASASESSQDTANDQWREAFDYQKEQDAKSNAVTMISNALGLTGTDQLSGELLAEGLAAYESGDEAFQQWVSKARSYDAGDGINEFTRETKTYQPPPGWTGDWNALSSAEQSLILTGYNLGLDPATPPPNSGITQEAWDSLDAYQKEQILRGKSGPTQP